MANYPVWVRVIICTLLNAVATVNVLIASSDIIKPVEIPTLKSLSRFDKINRLDSGYSYWQFLSLACPLKYYVTFIQSILERVQRWRISWMRSIYLAGGATVWNKIATFYRERSIWTVVRKQLHCKHLTTKIETVK